MEILPGQEGQIKLLAFDGGTYELETAGGRTAGVELSGVPSVKEITGPWTVRFPPARGAPPSKTFDRLISWTDDADDRVKYFSGIATYEKEFDVPAELFAADRRLALDLGRVRFVADVRLNDQYLDILWRPPFRVDVTDVARPGRNRLVVRVANVWSNRLTGDARAPPEKRYCRTNMTRALSWKSPWAETPLKESGLLGPVRLVPAVSIQVQLTRSQ